MSASRSRSGGYLVVVAVALGLAVIGTFVLGRTYSKLALQPEPFDRLSYVPSFDPIEDVTLGLSSNATNAVVSKADRSIRAIEVYPTQTILLAGGKAVRRINTPAPATMAGLVRVVHQPGWLSQGRGAVTMKAAVLIENGSSMRIASPVTRELTLQVKPGVFLGATRARLVIDGVAVKAGDTATPTTASTPSRDEGRPFVLATNGSHLLVSNSSFSYLGRDWNSSYGLTWSKNASGFVRNSTFQHDFIGVYSNDSHGLQVLDSTFLHNSLYGVDPHSGSSNLLIAHNTANDNGRHGIIFSDHVTHGVVRDNVTEGNGLNGIMMDEASTGNVIENNTVENNDSDGIVMANSSNNTITGNTVKNNRVGITIRGTTTGTVISRNTITDNKMAAQGTSLSGNSVSGNGGQWSARRIAIIWLAALGLLLILLAITWFTARRNDRQRPSATGTAQVGTA